MMRSLTASHAVLDRVSSNKPAAGSGRRAAGSGLEALVGPCLPASKLLVKSRRHDHDGPVQVFDKAQTRDK
jgi:hypothetical protein